MKMADVAQPQPRSVGFRSDLQGLRAIAVILVVVFHTGYALPGGFIGVDVFFVLSGFLIIGLLDREAEQTGRIDLGVFFARRARRLLPTLALVTTVTVAASTLVVELGDPLRAVVRTAVGASLSLANAVLYVDSNYFATAAERNPLLHTWSLSVEEQFYFAVPIVLALTLAFTRPRYLRLQRRLTRRGIWIALLAVGSCASFAANVFLVNLGGQLPGLSDPLSFAFYAPATRAWQFGAGGLFVLFVTTTSRRIASHPRILRPIGLIIIGVSALLLESASPYPGMHALLPTVGTLMMLAPHTTQGGDGRGWLVSLVSSRPLALTGDLSYSWYLWHWPAIVLSRAALGNGAAVVWGAVAASFGLALLTQRVVEDRFRTNQLLLGVRAIRLAAACAAIPITVALAAGFLNERVAESAEAGQFISRTWSRAECHVQPQSNDGWPRQRCIRGAVGDVQKRSVDVLLIGDSHAASMSEGLLAAADQLGLSVGVWTVSGAPPFGPVGNSLWMARYLDLVAEERPKAVVVAARSSEYVTDDSSAETWGRKAREAVIGLQDLGAHVVWVLNVPEFPGDAVRFGTYPTLVRPNAPTRSITLAELAVQRELGVNAERLAFTSLNRLTFIDPADELCRPDCRNADAAGYLYYDDNHLSAAGSRTLSRLFERALRMAVTHEDDLFAASED